MYSSWCTDATQMAADRTRCTVSDIQVYWISVWVFSFAHIFLFCRRLLCLRAIFACARRLEPKQSIICHCNSTTGNLCMRFGQNKWSCLPWSLSKQFILMYLIESVAYFHYRNAREKWNKNVWTKKIWFSATTNVNGLSHKIEPAIEWKCDGKPLKWTIVISTWGMLLKLHLLEIMWFLGELKIERRASLWWFATGHRKQSKLRRKLFF